MHCPKCDQFDKIKAHQKKKAAKEKNKNKESLKESKRSAQRGQRWRGKANLQGEGQPEQQEKKHV